MFKFLVTLFFAFFSYLSFAQRINENESVFIDKEYSEKISVATDSIVKMMKKKSIPGLSVSVSIKGKTIWSQGFGYSDMENGVPVRINTKFRIGSVSKTITAIGLAKLIDKNKINLDSPVTNYVAYWPVKRYPITVGQVGSHVAGIRHYSGYEFNSAKHYNNVEESVEIFKNDTLRYVPGTIHFYSSYGYVLLSAAIEGASGKPFLNFLYDEIFSPLGMKNTVPDHNDSIIPNRSQFYMMINNKKLVNAIYVDNSNKWGSGGILSTSYDLLKLGNALLQNKIISVSSKNVLWTPYKLSTGKENVYGIGFRNEKDKAGRTFMSHGGTSIGGRTFFVIYPKEELVMAITYNLLPAGYNEIEISDIFVRD